jgi:hypothetical protein
LKPILDETRHKTPFKERRVNEGWRLLTHQSMIHFSGEATPQQYYRPRSWYRLFRELRMPEWDGKVEGRLAIEQKYTMLAWCVRYMMLMGLLVIAFLTFNVDFQLDRSHNLHRGAAILSAGVAWTLSMVVSFVVAKIRAVVIVNRKRELAVFEQKEEEAKRVAEKLTLLLAENGTLKKMLAVTDEEADKLRVELQDRLRKLREQQ